MTRSAKKTAVDLLSRREHSRFELTRKLAQHEFSSDEIDTALSELMSQGYQSDERFASAYARVRSEKGYGPQKIRQELSEKGIAADLIAPALMGFDWEELAQQALEKRFGKQPPEDYPEQAKRMRFLQYRGFSLDHIKIAVADLLA